MKQGEKIQKNTPPHAFFVSPLPRDDPQNDGESRIESFYLNTWALVRGFDFLYS